MGMSVKQCIDDQIARDGMTPENILVKRLYDLMISNNLSSQCLWNELTKCSFKKYGVKSYESHQEYHVKPELLTVFSNLLSVSN